MKKLQLEDLLCLCLLLIQNVYNYICSLEESPQLSPAKECKTPALNLINLTFMTVYFVNTLPMRTLCRLMNVDTFPT